jgi:hypothetical protein
MRYIVLALVISLAIGCAKKEEEVGPPTPTGPIVVGVVKSEGKPVAEAYVAVEALGVSTTTGADGSFKLTGLVEGSYDLVVRKEGYVGKAISITVGAEGTVNIGEVEILPSGTITGKVMLGDAPATNIPIAVEDEPYSTTTGGDGIFSIELPVGDHVLVVRIGDQEKKIPVTVEKGKAVAVEDIVFEILGPSDEFNGTKLDPKWKWAKEPKVWDVGKTKKGFLYSEGDVDSNLWTSDAANRLYQLTNSENFEIEAHIITEWSMPSNIAGIIIKSPAIDNWVCLKFWMRSTDSVFEFQNKGVNIRQEFNTGIAPPSGEVWFKLVKKGDLYESYYKRSEKEPWTMLGQTNYSMPGPYEVGLFWGIDGSSGAGTFKVWFDYFRGNFAILK